MRIGVLGSWRPDSGEWKIQGTREQFESACSALGKELARRHQTIIVGADSPSTADYYIVRGFLEIIGGTRPPAPLIEVVRPNDSHGVEGRKSYLSLAKTNPGVFRFHLSTQSRWTEAHLLTVREADCVLVMGGKKYSYRAGLAAIVAGKRLIPVGCFGGAASRLLRDLAAVNPADPHDLLSLNGPWDDTVLGAVLRWAGIGRRPRIMLVHGHSDDRHELQSWLQQQDFCDVLVMQQEFGGSRTFPEKFEQVASTADGAVALATPDDAGAAADEGVLASRARQNVWLEVGWFWGHLGRDRLFLLLKGDLEVPSDLAGVEYYQYKDAPSELAKQLTEFARRLTGASIP